MTDTTDTAALRESAERIMNLLENLAGYEPQDIDMDAVELRFEDENGFDTGCDISIVDTAQQSAGIIRGLLDQLEAERQRADEYRDCIRVLADQLSVNALPNEIIEAVAELEAVKGEQVPVAWTSQRSLETKNKIVAFTDDMSALDYGVANGWTDIVELFTAPQKPVVLPAMQQLKEAVAFYLQVQKDNPPVEQGMHKDADEWLKRAAIEAAGGIVKDGE